MTVSSASSLPYRAGHDTPRGREIIDLSDVRKTYRSGTLAVEALRGVTLTIGRGEFVAIMGPSGSGKSTMMHVIGCLDVPSSGSYYLSGADVGSMSEAELAIVRNRRIGFVFQQFNLLPSLTAGRNVELPLLYAGDSERGPKAQVALTKVGLADRVDHRPGQLSGGEQQRVAVARALVTDPDLILADEPTGNLDSMASGEILRLFQDLNKAGRTVVLITHEADVASYASRVVRFRDGAVQSEDGGAA